MCVMKVYILLSVFKVALHICLVPLWFVNSPFKVNKILSQKKFSYFYYIAKIWIKYIYSKILVSMKLR